MERDGRLTVHERVTVPDGAQATRIIRLRQPIGDDLDRTFAVTGETVDNGGRIDSGGDSIGVTFNAGVSTLRYTVDGAIADVGTVQEVRWLVSGGWDVDVDSITVTFAAPMPASSLTCLAGPAGSSRACMLAQISDTRLVTAREVGLAAGDRVELMVGLPGGTVPANVRLDETFSLARAFRFTPTIGIALLALLLGGLGGMALVWRARRRDAMALRSAGAGAGGVTGVGAGGVTGYEPLVRDGDRVRFASPGGVLPGQIGTVVDEHVDVIDIAATVVDLAVRNYLWLAEEPDGDWLIVRRNQPDGSLRPYERAIYDAVLGGAGQAETDVLLGGAGHAGQDVPLGGAGRAETDVLLGGACHARQDVSLGGADQAGPGAPPGVAAEVPLGGMRGSIAAALPDIRDRLYADVVGSGWFRRRPGSGTSVAGRFGAAVAAAGVVLTVLLAVFTTFALLGLAVAVAGAALWLGARQLPVRTAPGRRLLGQLVVLRDSLRAVDPHALPEADRELVFSRSLPYAVVLGEAERWLAAFADLDPEADGTPGLYWCGAPESPDLRQFAARFPVFVSSLGAALAQAGHLRSFTTANP